MRLLGTASFTSRNLLLWNRAHAERVPVIITVDPSHPTDLQADSEIMPNYATLRLGRSRDGAPDSECHLARLSSRGDSPLALHWQPARPGLLMLKNYINKMGHVACQCEKFASGSDRVQRWGRGGLL